MAELKHKMTTRSNKQPATEAKEASTQKQQQKAKSKPKSNGQKKPLQQKSLLDMFKNAENQIIAEPLQIKYSIKQLLKNTTTNEIMQHCPKIKQLYDLLSSQPCISQKLVFACLDKYFHGNNTMLWANKYSPRNLGELFQSNFAQKIQQWIKDFYYFRKEDVSAGSDLDFIDDQPEESYSKSLQIRMVENGWNCKALVLRGRSGVGKTSFLNAIAKSMRIRCFQYASDVDQLQKMKQMFDGSQSQCVNNYQIKKKQQMNNKLIRENSSITKFIPSNQKKQALQTKQPRRMQIFRNFSYYFAPYEKTDKQQAEDSYLRQLFGSINKSSIPYVLTTDKPQLVFREKSINQSFQKLDQIQFIENSIQDLTYLYWTIYQIESNITVNLGKKIKKQQLFHELNQQFSSLEFHCRDNLHLIRQLVIAANKKILYIAKYLQFMVFGKVKGLEIANSDKMSERCLEEAIEAVGREIVEKVDSDGLINSIQWNLYNKVYEDANPLEQTAAQEIQKSQKSLKLSQKSCQVGQKKPSLKQLRYQLQINCFQDKKIFKNQYYNHNPQPQNNIDNFLNIPIESHLNAKKKIIKNIKNRIFANIESKQKKKPYFKLSQKQLYYLPIMFPSKRVSARHLRKQNRQPLQENLSKIMTCRELAYLEKFGKFVST